MSRLSAPRERSTGRGARLALLSLPLVLLFTAAAAAGLQEITDVRVPDPDIGEDTLDAQRNAQLATAAAMAPLHDFAFTDRQPESGITFENHVVEDAARNYKAAHYDHGNGVAVADVDGDGLLDLYFTTQLGSNELWRNLGDGRFENITDRAGVGLANRVGVSAAFGDIDNDGDADLFATTVRGGNALFENDGAGNFTDISAAAGVDYSGHSSGAVFVDYDGDSLLDLLVTNVGVYTRDEQGTGGFWVALEDAFFGHLKPERTERSILYRNLGGSRFSDVSSQMALVDGSWSGDASVVDFNADGWSDLYILNMQGDDHLYENREGRAFVERTSTLFPATPWGAMGIKSFDYDNDGRLDLFLTDMHSDMTAEVGPEHEHLKPEVPSGTAFFDDNSNNVLGNAFYHQLEDGSFEEISGAVGLENFWPWGTSVGDVNADGYEDVFITTSMNYPFRYQFNTLRLNDAGGGFVPAEFILGVEPRRGGAIRTPWFELDCGGDDWDHMRCQGHEGRVRIWGALGTRSSAIVDIDNDGDLDIVTNEFGHHPQVLISDLAQRHDINWLAIELVGSLANRDAVGARVTVHAGELTLTQINDGKSGYLSHSSMPQYFGLGGARTVDRIEVMWPAGGTQVIEGPIETSRLMTIEER